MAQDQLGLALGREFRTLASLRHPNIVSVFDYGFEAPHRPFFTMELLRDAQPLFEVAHELRINARVHLLLSVLQALSYLHRRGVLHRDLKPANVMVSNGRVVVLDFGLAVLRGTERLRQAELAGTLPYMAQEILLGDGPSVASDLYAFGVMATQLLTGHLPFEAGSRKARRRSCCSVGSQTRCPALREAAPKAPRPRTERMLPRRGEAASSGGPAESAERPERLDFPTSLFPRPTSARSLAEFRRRRERGFWIGTSYSRRRDSWDCEP